ncbi:MAG: serine--tRNA ligase, partial [Tepidisphaeraceae bacterium]
MIDLKDLRERPDTYRQGAANKGVRVDIDAILDLDNRQRAAQQTFETLRSEQNTHSQQIGKLKDPEEKKAAVARVGELKAKVKEAEESAKAIAEQLQPLLLQVPQPADEEVPVGKDASENVIARHWGEPRAFDFKPKSHIELAEQLGIVNFNAGVRLAGSRSYMLLGAGAELHQAILRLAVE